MGPARPWTSNKGLPFIAARLKEDGHDRSGWFGARVRGAPRRATNDVRARQARATLVWRARAAASKAALVRAVLLSEGACPSGGGGVPRQWPMAQRGGDSGRRTREGGAQRVTGLASKDVHGQAPGRQPTGDARGGLSGRGGARFARRQRSNGAEPGAADWGEELTHGAARGRAPLAVGPQRAQGPRWKRVRLGRYVGPGGTNKSRFYYPFLLNTEIVIKPGK
jgi:hypothetical protein